MEVRWTGKSIEYIGHAQFVKLFHIMLQNFQTAFNGGESSIIEQQRCDRDQNGAARTD